MRVAFLDTIVFDKFLIITKIIYTYNLLPYIVSRHQKLINYYTDEHNVDEDRVTITSQGGRWCELSTVGVSDRYIWNSPSSPSSNVASLKT